MEDELLSVLVPGINSRVSHWSLAAPRRAALLYTQWLHFSYDAVVDGINELHLDNSDGPKLIR